MNNNEIRETVKLSEKSKLDFNPKNADERKYLEKLNTILGEKRKGDWLLVGEICGITSKNAEIAFGRVYSKYHAQAVAALETVIANRKQMLQKS